MSNMFLTREEVAELSGFKRYSKQIEALRLMGIPCRINPNGRPIVVRAVIEGGLDMPSEKSARTWKSNKAKQ